MRQSVKLIQSTTDFANKTEITLFSLKREVNDFDEKLIYQAKDLTKNMQNEVAAAEIRLDRAFQDVTG